ncbi:MAG: thiamine-phosphate kinase [Planctomycetota bacterium]
MELDFVSRVIASIPPDPRLEVPPGDDAAVIRPPAERRTVVTVDMLMDGVDFRLGSDCTPRQVGHKALAVSLSDLAAMAARPELAVAAVALPRHQGDEIGRGVLDGMLALAARHGITLAGGDTNAWDGPLVVSITALGSVPPGAAWRRDGAHAGDLLVVSGACGGSLLGRHLAVTPRIDEALAVAAAFEVHAAIDVSDGLSLDLSRMMLASGTGAILDLAAVPIHPDAVIMAARDADRLAPLDHALGDGEDFELLLAMPAAEALRLAAAPVAGTRFTVIGEVTSGSGLSVRQADGTTAALAPRGYEHAFDG